MPTYDYVCQTCGHRLEVMHGVHAHGPSACPVCGGEMRKAFAPPAVHFKGSGWARKERGSRHAKSAASSETKADSSGASEKKPAADSGGDAG